MSLEGATSVTGGTTLLDPSADGDYHATRTSAQSRSTFRRAYWAALPTLAVAAYFSTLRVGFLSDDYVLAYGRMLTGFRWSSLLPDPTWAFYRPVSTFFTWGLGWHFWGPNPWPYHLLSLLLHAVATLALGLWLAEATQRRPLGWLAGALFAVFPLHTEAVGWIASQWDVWAAAFGLVGLWLFTWWWRTASERTLPGSMLSPLYTGAVLGYGLALYSKESWLLFLPVFALSAWFVTPRITRRQWLRLAIAMLPFAALLASNVALRFAYMGSIGGYNNVNINNTLFFWDGFNRGLRLLIAPVNQLLLGSITEQIVAAIVSIALLVGLVFYGRTVRRLLLVVAVWLVAAILPIFNILSTTNDLQQDRLLYLAAAGYCVGVEALIYTAFEQARGWQRSAIMAAAGVLLAVSAVTSWVQMRPWQAATQITAGLNEELSRLIPSQPRQRGMIWYVEDMPDTYMGAYIYREGLGIYRAFGPAKDVPWAQPVVDARAANLTADNRDGYALRFAYDAAATRYHVYEAAGVSYGAEPPTAQQSGDGLVVWDFRDCSPDAVRQWDIHDTKMECKAGSGLTINSVDGEAKLVGPEISVDPRATDGYWVRVREGVRYAEQPQKTGLHNQLFWYGPDTPWSEKASATLPVWQDGRMHTYWNYIPADHVGKALTRLRFDPLDGAGSVEVMWIALDVVR
ncbi:MAG: hypothetical protein ABI670_20900 [Chloroflexota bacterium]